MLQSGKKLFIIAEAVEGAALSTLLVTRLKGVLNVVCVKAGRSYGEKSVLLSATGNAVSGG